MQTTVTEAEEKRYAELQQMALDFARNGEIEPLTAMLDAGMPANLSDAKGNSLLMLASYNGHVETTRMLLEHGAEVDRRNDHGQTPLGGVALKGYEEIVDLLLQHGADINADNGAGMTPIMFAALFGRTRVVEQLRCYGASLKRRNRLGISARLMVSVSRLLARLFRKPQLRPGGIEGRPAEGKGGGTHAAQTEGDGHCRVKAATRINHPPQRGTDGEWGEKAQIGPDGGVCRG